MEFELEEFIVEAWLDQDEAPAGPNHAPAWCHDRTGQTGVWIPEEAPAPTAKQLEPTE